jgi:hypothetical protein
MLSLPSGAVHGRVDVAGARAVVDGAIVVDLLRGLSGLPEAAQAATIAVARDEDVDLREVDVLVPVGDRVVPLTPAFATDGTVDLEVRAHDGRTWRVTVGQEPLDVARRESCAKEPVAGTRWVAAPPEPMSPWRQAGGPLVPVLR